MTITRSISTLLMFIMMLVLQACGGGGGGGTPPAVNTSLASAVRGYYDGAATINGGTKSDVTIASPNTKAIVDESNFVVAFKGQDDAAAAIVLLYKGTFTEVTDTTFKANVRVYVNGYYKMTSTISDGVINAGVSVSGTLVGTGDYANSVGKVTLSYSSDNNLAPPAYLTDVANRWSDAVSGDVVFNTPTNLDFIFAGDNIPGTIHCDAKSVNTTNVTTVQPGRVRSFTTTGLSNCVLVPSNNGLILTGYFTNYNGNGSANDRMLLVASNNDFAYVGILPCLAGTCY